MATINFNISIYEECNICGGKKYKWDHRVCDNVVCTECNEDGKVLNNLGEEILKLIEDRIKEIKTCP
jgi:hypothetical protein